GVQGTMTLDQALQRLLAGTEFDYRVIGGAVVRISRRAPVPPRPVLHAPPPPPRPEPESRPRDIIVTGSKQDTPLADYPGSVQVDEFSLADGFRLGSEGSGMLLRTAADLTSTDLGPGRNKIFIRGISDSSFNGLTQATISQYLGESRLIYSAPDPDLALYDIERVEILEGPQGTLYGAGSLGGVIRLVPRPPELGQASLAATAGLALTGGEVGGDAAAVANLPLSQSSAARVVGYRSDQPGYIDDPQRGLSDINRTTITGIRATLAAEPAADVHVQAGVVAQDLASRDGQYTNNGTSALIRRTALSQPFDNDFRLAFVTLRARVGSAQLVSNTSYADHSIDTAFDATRPSDLEPRLFTENQAIHLLTHETRIAGSSGRLTNWVGGIALAHNVNHVERSIGDPAAPAPLSAVRSDILDAAVFGEGTVALTGRVSLTAGGRLAYFGQSEELEAKTPISFEPRRSEWRVLPSAAISWQPSAGLIVYARYHQGVRPGAQQIAGDGRRQSVLRYEPDELATKEVGVRLGEANGTRLHGAASFAWSRWNDIQADLITPDGFPYIANIGAGMVRYASVQLGWRPVDGLDLDLSGFLATSQLDRPAAGFASAGEGDLPEMADSGWRAAARYSADLGAANLTLSGSVAYVGNSYLGIGPMFDRPQGDYLNTALGARVERGRWGLSIDLDNLLNSRANTFSYGNPFAFAAEDQRTPLRPRTIRIGIDASF
ncbi:MAG: TonB-dependent receptor domain-containing protein, partial [Tsuneonella sp.]